MEAQRQAVRHGWNLPEQVACQACNERLLPDQVTEDKDGTLRAEKAAQREAERQRMQAARAQALQRQAEANARQLALCAPPSLLQNACRPVPACEGRLGLALRGQGATLDSPLCTKSAC